MNMGKDESPYKFTSEKMARPVLVNSEKKNAIANNTQPRTREITSRYKNGTKSTPRSPSPIINPKSPMLKSSDPKRSVSAERVSRPSTPSLSKSSSRPSSPLSSNSSRSTTPVRNSVVEKLTSSRKQIVNRAPDGLWPSIRSLSTSFQSESSSVSSCSRSEVSVLERKRTPLRGRKESNQLENSKPVENSLAKTSNQRRWPSMIGGKMLSNNALSKSVDLTDKIKRTATLPNSNRRISPTKGFANSTNESTRPVSSKGQEKNRKVNSLSSDKIQSKDVTNCDPISIRGFSPTRGPTNSRVGVARPVSSFGFGKSKIEIPISSERAQSRDVVTSNTGRGISPSRGTTTFRSESARSISFNQEKARIANSSRLERANSSDLIACDALSTRGVSPTKGFTNSRNEAKRPSSSSGLEKCRNIIPNSSERASSVSRARLSPSRTRPSTPGFSCTNASTRADVSSSVFNYISDVRKGKKSLSHIEESHQLRMLYNRDLQWRFINARADIASLTQIIISEDMLYNVWIAISELRESVTLKRIRTQNLRHEMKLRSMLTEQVLLFSISEMKLRSFRSAQLVAYCFSSSENQTRSYFHIAVYRFSL